MLGEQVRRASGSSQPVFNPRCVFSRSIAVSGAADFQQVSADFDFHRSREEADAVVVKPGQQAVIFNADCPILALEQQQRLIVVHAGLGSFVDRTKQGRKGLLDEVVARFGTRFGFGFFGYGIGPCCYSPPWLSSEDLPGYSIEDIEPEGPPQLAPRIDLMRLVALEIRRLGVRIADFNFDEYCTACSPHYHSNKHDGPDAGRNAAFFWLD